VSCSVNDCVFEVLTAANMKMKLIWVVALCCVSELLLGYTAPVTHKTIVFILCEVLRHFCEGRCISSVSIYEWCPHGTKALTV
jgi:hypothetical protein